MKKKKIRSVTLAPRDYQPSRSELRKGVGLDIPGDTPMERFINFTRAVVQPVKIRYRKRK